MIIFISDLHMSDNTAGPSNIPPKAFSGTFAELEKLAADAKVTDLTLVFLGDMFDLIRTTGWQGVEMADRPWGAQAGDAKPLPKSASAAEKIFDAVMKAEQNEKSFEIMRKAFKKVPNVKRVYVPGNHDRPCNMYPELRKKASEVLGLGWEDPAEPFQHYFVDTEHACFARHGHEWDSFNFDGEQPSQGIDFLESDYFKTPIGDVLAAEVSSTLPAEVLKLIPAGKCPPGLESRLRNLFDIRPNSAMAEYLAFQIKSYDDPVVEQAINDAVDALATEFEKNEFVDRWMKQQFHLFKLSGPMGALALVLGILKIAHFKTLSRVLAASEGVSNHLVLDDNHASKAAIDFHRLDADPRYKDKIRYVLYGHTHQPDQQAISVVGTPPDEMQRVYLNTGMWRPGHNKGVEGGFITWKNLTHTTIYHPKEIASAKDKDKASFPGFEVWTGALKDVP